MILVFVFIHISGFTISFCNIIPIVRWFACFPPAASLDSDGSSKTKTNRSSPADSGVSRVTRDSMNPLSQGVAPFHRSTHTIPGEVRIRTLADACRWTDAVALLVKTPVPSGGDRPRRSLSH